MMKMNDFTIYCTTEQTKKALELGAPINLFCKDYMAGHINYMGSPIKIGYVLIYNDLYYAPTVEQMIGWLRKENNIFFTPKKVGDDNYVLIGDLKHYQSYDSYEEASLAGIDVALEYLINNNLIK